MAMLRLAPDMEASFQERGFASSPSARTGQELRVDRVWIDEQDADREAHDLLAICGRVDCPVAIVHGGDDPTVPPEDGRQITAALGDTARFHLVSGANHVFNVANPMVAVSRNQVAVVGGEINTRRVGSTIYQHDSQMALTGEITVLARHKSDDAPQVAEAVL